MGNCLGGENEDDITPLHGAPTGADQLENGGHSQGHHQSDPGSSPLRQQQQHHQSPPEAERMFLAHQRQVAEPPPPYFPTEDRPSSSHYSGRRSPPVKMSEEEQMKLAKKLGLLQQIPTDIYVEGGKGDKECIICMVDFEEGEDIRFLPCLHTYHLKCIDEWLLKSFTCPSCMEPVDSALFSSYHTAELSDLAALSTSPAATAATARKSTSSAELKLSEDKSNSPGNSEQ